VVFNQARQAGCTAISHDASVCPVCVAAVDDRPHHGLGDRRRAWRLLAHREHNRYGATAALVAAAGPDRLAGVRIIGIDEHRWAPRRYGTDGFVTVIIDLTPVHDRSGPARLLDVVARRSATALASWLSAQTADFAQTVQVLRWTGSPAAKPQQPR
jgi:hypothetical protein